MSGSLNSDFPARLVVTLATRGYLIYYCILNKLQGLSVRSARYQSSLRRLKTAYFTPATYQIRNSFCSFYHQMLLEV